jgi:hypothetical protein
MKYLLVILFLLNSALLNAQAEGSFFIVASGSDGIMVATDSRSAVCNNSQSVKYGYHDFGVKTLTIGNVAMVVLGTDVFSGQYVNGLFEEYKKTAVMLPKVSEVLPQFFDFCSKKLAAKDYALLSKNRYLVCGYEKGISTTCMQDGSIGKRECVSEGWIRVASDASDFEPAYAYTLPCNQLGKLAESSINKYAAYNGLQNEIGGPIRILRITMNGLQWLQNKPQVQLLTLESAYKDFMSGKIPVTFTPKTNKEKFDLMVRKDYPQLF